VRETPERVAATSSQPRAFCSDVDAWLRRGESAAHPPDSDGHSTGETKSHESSIRTLPTLCGGSQQRGGRTHIYHARIARQVWATHAPLAVKSRPMQQADGASLSPTDATKPTAWRRGSAHPDHLIRCYDRVLLRATIGSGRDVAYADTCKRANELEQPRIGSSRMQEGEPEGARFGSCQVRFVNNQPDCRAMGRGGGPRAWQAH
jgi:hypothetical protein